MYVHLRKGEMWATHKKGEMQKGEIYREHLRK